MLNHEVNENKIIFGAGVLIAVFYGVVLSHHNRPLMLQLWDESRLAVNAIEMYISGFSLITTYDFRPDLWNTKPPLLIWLQLLSMKVFGPSLWALRLPTILAASGTILGVFVFARKISGSYFTAILAVSLLALSRGFTGIHAALTGDYDCTLTFFTTMYLFCLFFMLHRREPTLGQSVAFAALLTAAVMTKGVAGLLPGVGIPVYLLLTRRFHRILRSPRYWIAGAGAALLVLGYYFRRETLSPGYFDAVSAYELGGRFNRVNDGHQGPFIFYVLRIFKLSFFAGPLTFIAPAFLLSARGRLKTGLLFVTVIAFTFILLISAAQTKLVWYVVPAYPFLALMCAFAFQVLAGNFDEKLDVSTFAIKYWRWALLSIVPGIIILSSPSVLVLDKSRTINYYSGGKPFYGELFDKLDKQGIKRVVVAHKGLQYQNILVDYDPQLKFYKLLWEQRGMSFDIIGEDLASVPIVRNIVASCDDDLVALLRQRGVTIATAPGCAAVALSQTQ